MSKFFKAMIVVAVSSIFLASCSHTISIEQAASGHAGKCSRNHL